MHRALQIHEVLFNIFDHCRQHDSDDIEASDLASLARTCCTFKEPALDMLWKELGDLSPLVVCLPEVFQLSSEKLSMGRPLTQAEWDTLQRYTRRVRSISDFNCDGLDHESLRMLSSPPTTEPLFPNLVTSGYTVNPDDPQWFQDSYDFIPKLCPNIRSFFFDIGDLDPAAIAAIVSRCICQWQNLRTLLCHRIPLDMGTLVHLSRMPKLAKLDLSLVPASLAFDSPLLFSNLRDLILQSDSCDLIARFLCRCSLPVMMDLAAVIVGRPSRHDLSSFWTSVQTANPANTVKGLTLYQPFSLSWASSRDRAPLLDVEDLRPCMAFRNLQSIEINISWNVGLTDSGLLALVSAWPHLERLSINPHLGWNTQGGITPNGFIRLLMARPSLTDIALVIDTRGYTEVPSPSKRPTTLLDVFYLIDVLDSFIEKRYIPALAAFFAGIAPSSEFLSWSGGGMVRPSNLMGYQRLWDRVFTLARDLGHVQRSKIAEGAQV